MKERKNSPCLLIYGDYQKYPKTFFQHLEKHLKQAGLSIIIQKHNSTYNTVFPHNNILLLFANKENFEEVSKKFEVFESVELGDKINYYFSVFAVLEKLFLDKALDSIISTFKKTYERTEHLTEPTSYEPHPLDQIQSAEKEKPYSSVSIPEKTVKSTWNQPLYVVKNKVVYSGIALILIILVWIGSFHYPTHNSFIRSDLIVPTESVLLHRSKVMSQIDNGFKNSQSGIQTIALVGPGGAGKTTLARQYAHQQKAPLIWEINAETKNSLIESFKNLANTFARTEEDKKTLRELTEIKKSSERERRLVEFVKSHLKLHSNWFLVYDNVEKFTDIQKYFPYDFETWGQGRILLTTRDNNIKNNKHINRTIQIGELDAHQKLILFSKIMNNGIGDTFLPSQEKEAITFLEKIPPYPLDISVAA